MDLLMAFPRHRRRAGSTVLAIAMLFGVAIPPVPAEAARIRDVGYFDGMRENQLVGYGLVIGLDGSGDKKSTGFTLRSMSSLLESVGMTIRPEEMSVKNVAAVLVTANLPPFSRAGSRLDVTVSSIGDATSLRGGVLVQTALEAADGQVYAVAQGPLAIGGFSADSPGGTRVSQNQVTVGRIPAGAIVEREVPRATEPSAHLDLILHRPDFTTAHRAAEVITRNAGGAAIAIDPGTVRIQLPDSVVASAVSWMSRIGELEVESGAPARVVVNERTGTVVAGGQVSVHAVTISHGNLSIRVQNRTEVYAPAPFTPPGTQTARAEQSDVSVTDRGGNFVSLPRTSTIEDLALALNTLGVSPRDVIAIFQALREAGALDAELVIL